MIKNRVIITPAVLPWDWTADYQRQTCLTLAKKNLVVVYLKNQARFSLKSTADVKLPKIKNVIFYQPTYLIPFRRFNAIEQLNQLISLGWLYLKYIFYPKILWIFDPDFYFFPQLAGATSLYDCVDFHYSPNQKINQEIIDHQTKLIKNCDVFTVNSHRLQQLHQPIRKAHLVPQGFAENIFKKYKPIKKVPKKNLVTILGFVGAINSRLDFKLIKSLIKQNPGWQFEFWGPIQKERGQRRVTAYTSQLKKYPNVLFGGTVNRQKIPSIIDRFTCGIIPYDISSPFNLNCFPMKLFEYFYLGKPVISTPIIELKHYEPLVKVGASVAEWEKHIRPTINNSWSLKNRQHQQKLARQHSWQKKITKISQIIEQN